MKYLVKFLLVILCGTAKIVPTATECLEHRYAIGNNEFTWQAAPSSNLWIPSDCLDLEKRLIFRRCVNHTWTPKNNEFQMMCHYENAILPSNNCPHHFESLQLQKPTKRNICIRRKGHRFDFIRDRNVCIQDSILTVDQSIEQQKQSIETITKEYTDYNGLFVQAAKWITPGKEKAKNVNYELLDVRCGRFGLPLKFNEPVPIHAHCTQHKCGSMCLYLNANTEQFSQIIDSCSEYVIAKPEKTFLQQLGCPSGYYRIESDYVESGNLDACFSIKMFPQPILVANAEKEKVIGTYCNGTIMTMDVGDDLFIFREMSEKIGLSDGNRCLFGLTLNNIVKYTDWESLYFSRTPFIFNWDKTMNYSRINEPGVVSYLAVKPNGQWTWELDSVSCIVCMVESPMPTAKLRLCKYNVFERRLELWVKNQHLLYKEKSTDLGFICFSIFRDVYKANLTVLPVANGRYLIEDVGMGEYWCSGHNVISRSYISTGESMFAYGIWFVFHVVRKCSTNCSFSPRDLNRFIECFSPNNEHFVAIKDSTITEHEQRLSDTEYSFTVLLSLTLHDDVIDNSVTALVNLTDYQLEIVVIYDQLTKGIFYDALNEMNIKSVRSTEYCLHKSLLSLDTIIWQIARIGETIPVSSLCPSQRNGSEIIRACSGDSVNGSFWEEPVTVPSCHTFVSENLLELYVNFSYSSQTTAILVYLEKLLKENINILLPLDVFLASRLLQKIANITGNDVQNLLSIYNSLMQIDENFLKMAASLNVTNILLEVLDNSLLGFITSSIIGSSEYENSGKSSIHSPFIKTFVLDPIISGASGIALYKPRNSSSRSSSDDDDLTIYSSRFIYPNATVDDLMTDKITNNDLTIGSYLPSDMLSLLKNGSVVMTVFFNDKLFLSAEVSPSKGFFKTNGKIITITILGSDDSSTINPIFLDSNGYSSSGCNLRQISVRTHFSILIDSNVQERAEVRRMTIIAAISYSFSFIGTLGVFLTALLAKKWRKKLTSKILINFSAAITLATFVMILINTNQHLLSSIVSNALGCVALGSVVHYSALVMYFWMLIFVYFQLKRYVAIFNFSVSRLLFKSIIFGWTAPLLPVVTILYIDHSLYLPKTDLNVCFPSGWALYLGVVVPISLISFLDCLAFVSILISLRRESGNLCYMTEVTTMRMAISSFLFVTLVTWWIFGISSKIFPNYYMMFSFIVFVTAAVQGLGIFFNFIVFDPVVRSLWLTFFRKLLCCQIRSRSLLTTYYGRDRSSSLNQTEERENKI